MEIFDAYVDDLVKQDKAKEKKGKGQSQILLYCIHVIT